MPSITIPETGVSSDYYVSPPTAGQLPYVFFNLPSGLNPPVDIVITLPAELYGPQQQPITSGPFTFSTSPTAATITLAGQPIWDFSDTSQPIRAAIRQAYDGFILQLEKPGNIPPQWIRQIQDMIASCMPSTFQESLYFRYRFDAANGYVDLVPGMRLRVDYAAYQFIYSANQPNGNALLDGFVGGSTAHLHVRGALVPGTGGEAIVFDPFFGSLAHSSVAANKGGAAGVLDLVGSAYQKPYYRLFYPKTLASSDGPGVSDTTQNVTLVGASTLADLNTATNAYLANQTVPVGATIAASFFRGRAAVIPEIGIFLQTLPIYVSLGTTIRQVYAGYNSISRAAGQTFPAWSSERSPSAFQFSGVFPNFVAIHPNPPAGATAAYADGTDPLDLPVLTGDAYQLKVANQ